MWIWKILLILQYDYFLQHVKAGRKCMGTILKCDTKFGQCPTGGDCMKLPGSCCSIDTDGQENTWRPNPSHFSESCGYCWTDTATIEQLNDHCVEDKDCTRRRICTNNKCRFRLPIEQLNDLCFEDKDCIRGRICTNNKCRFRLPIEQLNEFCVEDKDCGGLRMCRNNKCQSRIAIGRPFIVEGRSRTTSSQTCSSSNLKNAESWKMGEAPLVQSSNPYNQEIGRHWLKQAEAEHASVASFARHTLQLMSIGAPSRLLVASQEASVDEIKHAKLCYGFASAFIGSDLGPGSLDVNGSLESMDLKDIIRSLIIEGCIGETLSAIEAHFAVHNAEDTAVKAAVSQIASDETKHAQLAWDTIKWIIEKYPDTRIFAEEIFHVELEQRKTPAINDSSLFPATVCEDSEKDTSFRRYGLLVSEDRDKVSEAGIRDIIEPHYRAGFKGVNMISKQIVELDVANLVDEARFQDIFEPAKRAQFNQVDKISKHITEMDTVTL